MYIFSVRSSSGDDKCRKAVLCFPNLAPFIHCAAVNWGCKHDSVFLTSSVVTWSSALLDGKILDLVCSGDSTQPSKVILRGFFEGRFECLPSNTVYRSFLMFLRNMHGSCLLFQRSVWLKCCMCEVV